MLLYEVMIFTLTYCSVRFSEWGSGSAGELPPFYAEKWRASHPAGYNVKNESEIML